jgi:hypothetical protein
MSSPYLGSMTALSVAEKTGQPAYIVSHHHTPCHIIMRSVTSSYIRRLVNPHT